MQRAKAFGIDAFALNIGTDPYTDQQLGYAYQSAANNGMKVFISFDFNWWSPSNAAGVGQKIEQYAGQAAQLKINGAVFASSFAGDGLDIATLRSNAGVEVFFAPNFHPGQSSFSSIDGALNWMVSYIIPVSNINIVKSQSFARHGPIMVITKLLLRAPTLPCKLETVPTLPL